MALLLCSVVAGCAWHRSVVNARVRDLDTSFIQPGKTTWLDVVRELGPPDVPFKDLRTLHYRYTDHRVSAFKFTYFLFLPFGWYDRQRRVELLIETDNDGVVTSVARSRRDVVRPPLEGEGDRGEVRTTVREVES